MTERLSVKLPVHLNRASGDCPELPVAPGQAPACPVPAGMTRARAGRTGHDTYRRKAGFTLIEVLIVVAIIGLLAAIAYPSYMEYMKKTRRSDGHLALLNVAQSMERCKATNYTYATCSVPGGMEISPEGYYTIALDGAATATAFTLQATAASGSPQANDESCATMTLDSRGRKSSTDSGGSNDTSSTCW